MPPTSRPQVEQLRTEGHVLLLVKPPPAPQAPQHSLIHARLFFGPVTLTQGALSTSRQRPFFEGKDAFKGVPEAFL
jgi:hypothetical protein